MNLALVAAAAAGVQVGAATVASRFALDEVAPLTLAMLRYGIGALCLLPFALAQWQRQRAHRRYPTPGPLAWRDWLAMGLLGIGQFGLLIAALNFGLMHIDAARAALIFSLFPLMTLSLSAAMGRESIHPRLLAGVLVAIAGVALALAPKLLSGRDGHWIGELAVLTSAGIGAVCSVLYRPYLQRYPVLLVSTFAMFCSVVFLTLAALTEAWPSHLAAISPQTWMVVAFIGLSSAAGYWWWLYALRHESATRVTVFLALNPLTAALLGRVLLGERLDAWIAGAIALIATGLWLATRRPTLPVT